MRIYLIKTGGLLMKYKWYKNRFLVIGLVVVAFFAVFYISNLVSENLNIDVSGTMSLKDTSYGKAGDACDGSGGYSGITSGAQVTVYDNSSTILTVSNLGDGKVDKSGNCVFDFTVKNISNATVYQFEVSHRGKVAYSKQQLKDKDYKIELQLGE